MQPPLSRARGDGRLNIRRYRECQCVYQFEQAVELSVRLRTQLIRECRRPRLVTSPDADELSAGMRCDAGPMDRSSPVARANQPEAQSRHAVPSIRHQLALGSGGGTHIDMTLTPPHIWQ